MLKKIVCFLHYVEDFMAVALEFTSTPKISYRRSFCSLFWLVRAGLQDICGPGLAASGNSEEEKTSLVELEVCTAPHHEQEEPQ